MSLVTIKIGINHSYDFQTIDLKIYRYVSYAYKYNCTKQVMWNLCDLNFIFINNFIQNTCLNQFSFYFYVTSSSDFLK